MRRLGRIYAVRMERMNERRMGIIYDDRGVKVYEGKVGRINEGVV